MERIGGNVALCTRIEDRLAERVGRARYERYFRSCALLDLTSDGLAVLVPSTFYAGWLETRFGELLREAARSETGNDQLSLAWRVEPAKFGQSSLTPTITASPEAAADVAAEAPAIAPAPVHEKPRQRRPVDGPALRHRFADFVVGACNRVGFEAATRMASDSDDSFRTLFIHGDCGVGKTHLLQGLAAAWLEKRPASRVRYITGEAFTNEYVAAVRTNRVDAFRNRLRRLDLLCIDDVHFLAGKNATQAEFLHTFDALGLGGSRLAMVSDHHPRQLERFSDHLISRCMGGAVIRVDRPDPETRKAIARRIAAQRGVRLDDAAVSAIAASCTGSVRDIEGAIARVQAVSRLVPETGAGASVSAVAVQRALDDSSARRLTRPVKVLTIAETVCRALGVDLSEVLGRGRHKRVVLARSVTAFLAREITTQSYPEIAQALNRPNHSTIVTAFQRIKKQIAENQNVDDDAGVGRVLIAELCERLRRDVMASAQPV